MFERLIWVVPMTVAALGAWRPRAGLLTLVAALPLFGSPPGGPYLAALDTAALAAIATGWRGGRSAPSALGWPAAAFVALSLASLVPSPYWPPAWHPSALLDLLAAFPGVASWSALYSWRAAADLLLGWGLFLTIRRAFAGGSALPLARALLVGLVGVVVLGLASHVGLLDLGGFRPEHGSSATRRLHSVFFLSGWLAEYLVLATPAAITALVATGRRGSQLAVPLAALACVCLGLTLQRGAWGAAVAQVVFLAAAVAPRWKSEPRRASKAALAVGGALALTAVALVATGSPVKSMVERARSIESGLLPRLPLWTAAVDMTVDRPVLGWGLGTFTPAYDLAHPPGSEGASKYRNTAHSLYLDVAAERGVLGLLALGLLGFAVGACLVRPRAGQEALARSLGAGFVGALVYGLVQYLFHLRSINLLFWVLLGCVALVSRLGDSKVSGRLARALCALALVLVPLRAVLYDAPPLAGNRAFGLHETERGDSGPYRWTEGSAGMRIPWRGETLVLTLANGHPLGPERPMNVTVRVDGATVARLTVTGGWEEHRVDLGPPRKEWIALTLDAWPTFRPFSDYRGSARLSPSVDIRSLGVALRDPRWQ